MAVDDTPDVWFERAKAICAEHNPAVPKCRTCGDTGVVGERGRSLSPFSGLMVPDPQLEETWPCPDCETGR
jgi:hypothetical protein